MARWWGGPPGARATPRSPSGPPPTRRSERGIFGHFAQKLFGQNLTPYNSITCNCVLGALPKSGPQTVARRSVQTRAFLEPSGALFDKLHTSHEGYAGAVPIVHK